MSETLESRADLIRSLLDPANVAIVGASDKPGSWSKKVADILSKCGFRGPIYPINPRAASVWGGPCWRDLASLPERPDHVAILVPGAAAIEAVRDAGAAGARSATIFSSGFGEGGDHEGRRLGELLQAAVVESGMAVSGPNCMGNLAAKFSFATITDDRIAPLAAGPVAVVGQSGGIVMSIFRALRGRGVDAGYAITSGNEVGLTTADYIEWFARDETITVIACFIEAIRNPDQFKAACAAARAAGKPVVAIKIGGSDESRAAALAHTGSLAGSLDCFDAVTEPLGLIRVATLDDMVETVEYFAHARPPRGPRLGAMTFSGGLKGLMLEAAARNGLSFPPLSPQTTERIKAITTVGTSLGNPFDAGFAALSSAEAYFEFVRILVEDPNIDALILQEELPSAPGLNAKAANLRKVDEMSLAAGKPIAVVSMGSYMYTDHTREFRAGFPHLPVLQEVDRALRAVAAAGRYGALLESTDVVASTDRSPLRAQAEAILERALSIPDGRRVLSEEDSKALLALYAIPSPTERKALDADSAARAASQIGYPVALKLVSPEVQHKSDVGGVALGLKTPDEVAAAFEKIRSSLAIAAPSARFDGALVAPMISTDVELVLGVQRDPEVGPVVMFGAGGVLLELAKDVAFGPTPLTTRQAKLLVRRTAAGKLLDGYRGGARRDEDAVVAALVALARLAHDFADEIESVDINPLVALPKGVFALDALVVLRR